MNFFNFFCSQKVTMLAPEIFTLFAMPYTRIHTPGILGCESDYSCTARSTYPGIMYGRIREKLRREHGHFL
jgi:hypothetical protein